MYDFLKDIFLVYCFYKYKIIIKLKKFKKFKKFKKELYKIN